MPKAEGRSKGGTADIVFCIDSTGSMQECIDGVKQNLGEFVQGLQSSAELNFRLRLVSYRDLHDPTSPGPPWLETGFGEPMATTDFLASLESIQAAGGGDYRTGESSLDALFRAAKRSVWRDTDRCQRCIILITDDDAHPTLHHTTHGKSRGGLELVIQALQELSHPYLIMYVPEFEIYQKMERELRKAHGEGRFLMHYVPKTQGEEKYSALRAINWKQEMRFLGESISIASVAINRKPKE
jgi:hypothetical protein